MQFFCLSGCHSVRFQQGLRLPGDGNNICRNSVPHTAGMLQWRCRSELWLSFCPQWLDTLDEVPSIPVALITPNSTPEGLKKKKKSQRKPAWQTGTPVTQSLLQEKKNQADLWGKMFHIWLKADFPSGFSKKTGRRNTHFFSEWREMVGTVVQ